MSAELKVLTAEPLGVDVVEVLEDMLASAKKGEFSSVAVVYVTRSGETGSSWSRRPSQGLMIGAMTTALGRMVNMVIG